MLEKFLTSGRSVFPLAALMDSAEFITTLQLLEAYLVAKLKEFFSEGLVKLLSD